jgi:excinuclease ABC subunit A
LRLLYARAGTPHCYSCGKPIQTQTIQQIVDQILVEPEGTKFAVLAPIIRGKKGEYQKELLELRAKGFVRARIDGQEVNLAEPLKLKKTNKHDISIYIDRLVKKPAIQARLSEAVEMAARLADGLVEVEYHPDRRLRFFSTKFACADCGTSFPEVEPRSFSFNSPHGACPECSGLGVEQVVDPDKIIPNPDLSLYDGAIAPWADKSEEWKTRVYETLAKKFKFNPTVPFRDLPETVRDILLHGSGKTEVAFKVGSESSGHTFKQAFQGVIPSLKEALEEADPEDQEGLSEFVTFRKCSVCQGTRLRKEMTFVFVGGKNIAELCETDISSCHRFLKEVPLSRSQTLIAEPILREIFARLTFLENVGLNYLTLGRSAATISGGEAQRIRLATQIGSNLVGVLYVLDEPSIGLHQRDNSKLIGTLEKLRDQGNSVLVVEHDQETIERADFVVDIGPGAGRHGGEIIFHGTPAKLHTAKGSLTGDYLSGRKTIAVPESRRKPDSTRMLEIRGATEHNLKNVDVQMPLGLFICVTGVSGSGKSSLIIDSLLPALEHKLSRTPYAASTIKEIRGLEQLNKVIHVDQSPIGRTPRSNPATYTGLFTDIRTLFAGLPEAKVRGYSLSRFSFNVSGGRCENCSGDGQLKITMNFLPDVFIPCEVCRGKRYNRETLEIHYRGKSIADVLEMTIEDAASFFERVPSLSGRLKTLLDVGLGYVHLGQSAVTLSGGEAQRIKLARELSRRATGKTLYILDEPTTGLHFDDVAKLLQILQALASQGNTVVVIEHNLDVIKQADYLIELGPEGGDEGGRLLYQGAPEGLVRVAESHTGKYLAPMLKVKSPTRSSPPRLEA